MRDPTKFLTRKRNGFRKNDPKNEVKDDHDDKKVRVTMVGHVMEIFMLVTQPSILGCTLCKVLST